MYIRFKVLKYQLWGKFNIFHVICRIHLLYISVWKFWLYFPLHLQATEHYTDTCRQSNATLTIRAHFDWQANSNGRKYLSASTKPAFFGCGRADDGWFLSTTYIGLIAVRDLTWLCYINPVKLITKGNNISPFKNCRKYV